MKMLQLSLLLLLAFFVVGNAQEKEYFTQLEGTVIDQMGAVIPSTKIVLIGSKGKKFETITNENGTYLIRIPSGTYTIEAEYTQHQAWRKFKIEAYEIAETKKMRLDVCLRIDEEFTRKHGHTLTSEPIKTKKKTKSP
jgi:hypothetical protein